MNKVLTGFQVLIFFSWVLMNSTSVFAVEPDEVLNDPKLEERARGISKNLRCLVCRNESIDDSNAELAKDLRLLVRERLVLGESNKEITDYIVSRYGEYVLLMPAFGWSNLLLWLCGPIMLVFGSIIAFWSFKNKTHTSNIPLSEKDEQRIKDILKD
ncbi:MAG: cytochrome c-type biogenesis protein CcmH [Rhodobacteraceae bacterium]|nr:cytochrome c-type biogenesis protein CcmH [Paracoccaceae bacterium]